MWLRLISSKPILDAIQSSIDGTFSMDPNQWKSVVQAARLETSAAEVIGNAATSNANSFYLMLRRLNGKWQDLANVYATSSSQEMGRRFWSLDVGPLGIKNKVQRFIGLTYGVPGVIMDRWKYVEFWLPSAMRGTGAKQSQDYFSYLNKTPEDSLGIYTVYGGLESNSEAMSLAMYEGLELALQAAIDASPELSAALGSHANPGGLHWAGWNAIKNESVGHSSLDFTADLIRNFGWTSTRILSTLKLAMASTTPKEQNPPGSTPNSSSKMDKSELKGPAFPADFSDDIPEYSDEELEMEMQKAWEEQLKKPAVSASSASANSPQTPDSKSPTEMDPGLRRMMEEHWG